MIADSLSTKQDGDGSMAVVPTDQALCVSGEGGARVRQAGDSPRLASNRRLSPASGGSADGGGGRRPPIQAP